MYDGSAIDCLAKGFIWTGGIFLGIFLFAVLIVTVSAIGSIINDYVIKPIADKFRDPNEVKE